jgi:hypothetical protein
MRETKAADVAVLIVGFKNSPFELISSLLIVHEFKIDPAAPLFVERNSLAFAGWWLYFCTCMKPQSTSWKPVSWLDSSTRLSTGAELLRGQFGIEPLGDSCIICLCPNRPESSLRHPSSPLQGRLFESGKAKHFGRNHECFLEKIHESGTCPFHGLSSDLEG